jgi:hypothetical protein
MTTAHNALNTRDQHDRKVRVVRKAVGWEVREEAGQRLLRSVVVTDWHRVERAMQAFALAAPAVDAR